MSHYESRTDKPHIYLHYYPKLGMSLYRVTNIPKTLVRKSAKHGRDKWIYTHDNVGNINHRRIQKRFPVDEN